ncbi:hypothetical protein BH11ACT8_BH11ACT8_09210 [soil metagenome]
MVVLGVALALTAAALDLVLTSRLGVLFDLGYVAVCVGLALAVRARDFFTVGVLPPLLMLATFLLLAMSRAEAIATVDDGLFPAVVTGLSAHWVALALGNLLCLGVLAIRLRVLELRAVSGSATGPSTGPSRRPSTGPATGSVGEVSRTGPGRRLPA